MIQKLKQERPFTNPAEQYVSLSPMDRALVNKINELIEEVNSLKSAERKD